MLCYLPYVAKQYSTMRRVWERVSKMTKDFLGLRKLEKDLKNSFSFKEEKEKNQKKKKKPRQQAPKPLLTKREKELATNFGKKIIDAIKNRKINRLEKKYFKTKEEADRLAHEIKLRTQTMDNLENIQRYKNELEKLDQETKAENETCTQDGCDVKSHECFECGACKYRECECN